MDSRRVGDAEHEAGMAFLLGVGHVEGEESIQMDICREWRSIQ